MVALCLFAAFMWPRLVAAQDSGPPPTTTADADPGSHPQAMSKELDLLVQNVSALLGDRFAGADLGADGVVNFGVVDGTVVPPVLANDARVRVVTRRFSSSRLDAAMTTVVSRLNPLLAPGVEPGSRSAWPWRAGVDEQANVVNITVDRSHEDQKSQVEAALADELKAGTVHITYGVVEPVHEASCNRTSCTQPIRGGTYARGYFNGNDCTLGFPMRNGQGVRFQSTAGHCLSDAWYQGGNVPIGWSAWQQLSGSVDFQSIWQTNLDEPAPSNWVLRNSGTVAISTKIVSPRATIGNYTCTEGKRTGTSCGNISLSNATFGGRGGYGKMSGYICKGDSGAPTLNNSTLRAYGLLSGYDGFDPLCGTDVYFSWLTNYEAASGYQTLLTPTSETLGGGQRMPSGYALQSPNGSYSLQMQSDGNLVEYGPSNWIWQSYTNGNPGAFTKMQTDGRLVVYRSDGYPLRAYPINNWISSSRLTLQDDSNLVIYDSNNIARWTRTCGC
jgi:hypothetical protein